MSAATSLKKLWLRFLAIVSVGQNNADKCQKQYPRNKKIMVKEAETRKSKVDLLKGNHFGMNDEYIREYREIWKIADLLSNVPGFMLRRETKFRFRIVFTSFMIVVATSTVVYTLILVWPSMPQMIEVFCIIGFVVPAVMKLQLSVAKRRKILSMFEFTEKIAAENPTGPRADLLKRELMFSSRSIKMLLALFALGVSMFLLYPIYAFFIEEKLVPIMRMEFPHVDQTERFGYFIGLSIMVLMAVLACTGTVYFDIVVAFLIFNYRSLVELLIEDLEDYHKMWENKKEYSKRDLDYYLQNMCVRYSDTDGYMKFLNETFSDIICYSVCSLYLSLIFAVYAVINNGWMSGCGYVQFCFLQLYILCYLGTFVKTQNEKLNQSFYFARWYEYPVEAQKIFLILMHASSFNSTEIWIGPFAPLNIETGKQMTSNIYSYNVTLSNMATE